AAGRTVHRAAGLPPVSSALPPSPRTSDRSPRSWSALRLNWLRVLARCKHRSDAVSGQATVEVRARKPLPDVGVHATGQGPGAVPMLPTVVGPASQERTWSDCP